MVREAALFVPCYIDQCFPQVARATVRVLRRCGVRVHFDPQQTCCGQPAFNCGYWDEARGVAAHFLRVFARHEVIVAPSGSCVSMVRNHFARLVDDPAGVSGRVFELCEFLVDRLAAPDLGAALPGRAALHLPCHLLRELRGAAAVRRVLAGVRGLDVVELPSADWCCGFGGLFSVRFPELSAAMAERKLADACTAGLEYLVSPEAGCLMQLRGVAQRQGMKLRCLHVAEVLAGTAEGDA